jgi:hypothetical protein
MAALFWKGTDGVDDELRGSATLHALCEELHS